MPPEPPLKVLTLALNICTCGTNGVSPPAESLHPVLLNATETLMYTTSDGRVESIIRTLMCEIVNSVGHGNFTFVRNMSGKSEGILETSGCDNHKELMRGQLWASLHNVMCHIKAVITRLHHEIRLNLVTIGNHLPGGSDISMFFEIFDTVLFFGKEMNWILNFALLCKPSKFPGNNNIHSCKMWLAQRTTLDKFWDKTYFSRHFRSCFFVCHFLVSIKNCILHVHPCWQRSWNGFPYMPGVFPWASFPSAF